MTPLVTIAIPVYKRLNYLPGALRAVAAQTYQQIDLLVSDNGENGGAVEKLAAAHYPRPYRVRANPRSVSIVAHFNQLIDAAQGVFFVLLSDDDEISPNFVAELVGLLERRPGAAVALPRLETFSEDGNRVLGATEAGPMPPEVMSGMEFVRTWGEHRYKYLSFTTHLARTAGLIAAGGYPEFDRANGSDNALLVKQVIGREVLFSPRCTFRHRIHDTSYGKTASTVSLATASRQFLAFLDHDPQLRALRHTDPAAWAELRRLLRDLIYRTYLGRWRKFYRDRMGGLAWARAGFALPAHPRYTRQVLAELFYSLPGLGELARRWRRAAYSACKPKERAS